MPPGSILRSLTGQERIERLLLNVIQHGHAFIYHSIQAREIAHGGRELLPNRCNLAAHLLCLAQRNSQDHVAAIGDDYARNLLLSQRLKVNDDEAAPSIALKNGAWE